MERKELQARYIQVYPSPYISVTISYYEEISVNQSDFSLLAETMAV